MSQELSTSVGSVNSVRTGPVEHSLRTRTPQLHGVARNLAWPPLMPGVWQACASHETCAHHRSGYSVAYPMHQLELTSCIPWLRSRKLLLTEDASGNGCDQHRKQQEHQRSSIQLATSVHVPDGVLHHDYASRVVTHMSIA